MHLRLMLDNRQSKPLEPIRDHGNLEIISQSRAQACVNARRYPFHVCRRALFEIPSHRDLSKANTKSYMRNWQDIRTSHQNFTASTSLLKSKSVKNIIIDGRFNRILFLGSSGKDTVFSLFSTPLGTQHVDLRGTPTIRAPAVWTPLIADTMEASPDQFSKEQELQRERMRIISKGIQSFQFIPETSTILFTQGDDVMIGTADEQSGQYIFKAMKSSGPHFDPKLNGKGDMLAYIKDRNLWVTRKDVSVRLTDSDCETLSFGVAEYVVQEELDRYTGYWWSPSGESILYEMIDEKDVECVHLSRYNSLETHRYPRAGLVNASVEIRIASITIVDDKVTVVHKHLPGKHSLKENFPWHEYIAKLGWLADGSGIWLQLLDRTQLRSSYVKIPLALFRTEEECARDGTITPIAQIEILLEENSTIWINTTNILSFLKLPVGSKDTSFIFASERTGYRHLYKIQSRPPIHAAASLVVRNNLSLLQITGGEWIVADSKIHVDESRELVYFMGTADTPLERHLYVAAYSEEFGINEKARFGGVVGVESEIIADRTAQSPKRLTKPGFSHSLGSLDVRHGMFVSSCSNITTGVECELYRLSAFETPIPSAKSVIIVHDSKLVPQESEAQSGSNVTAIPFKLPTPELFSFSTSDGVTLHGLIFKPFDFEPSKQYPTLLHIYGGPHVQLVTNEYKFPHFSRAFYACTRGWIVVCIDSRGSWNRGLEFEGWIKGRMGAVELDDQIEGLIYLVRGGNGRAKDEPGVRELWSGFKQKGCGGYIDPKRVVISGWSYGGYLSLMGIARYPQVFCASIPGSFMIICLLLGAPVTDWELYDTTYTERYMGLPSENANGYKLSSVLTYAPEFPSDTDKFLIAHGLIDENVHFKNTEMLVKALISEGKPHRVQVYPDERHGLRGTEASDHFEVLSFSWVETILNEIE